MQCRGRPEDGEVFLADVWFSTYRTSAGSRLAAMVVDGSEDLRSREEFSLHQLMAGSRILVGAVSHEIRNVCGAIAVVHQNLARSGALAQNKDFEALGTLILALEKIAAMESAPDRESGRRAWICRLLLEELRIIVEPSLRRRQGSKCSGTSSRRFRGLGGPAEPDAGVPESDQEQRARHVEQDRPKPGRAR